MYETEQNILARAKEVMSRKDIGEKDLGNEFSILVSAYDNLLSDVQFITRISDRLQNRLNSINENLMEQTNRLESAQEVIVRQNEELKIAKQNLEDKVSERTKELKNAYDDLLITNRELDNFVYKASHDLKGPIATITGLCHVALREVEEPLSIVYLEKLESVSLHMSNVIKRLLSVSTLKEATVVKESFPLLRIIEHTQKASPYTLGSDKIKISFRHATGELFSDEEIFSLMLTNLLEYAVKNTIILSDWKERYIDFNFIQEGKNLQIYCSYNGQEIPKNLGDKIFDLFHRTSNHPEHTGMELYTANLATKKLGGIIELISSTQEETVFSVFLPTIHTTGEK